MKLRSLTRNVATLVLPLVVGLTFLGCTKATLTSPDSSPVKCQVTVASGLPVVTASGGSAVVSVSAQPECAWSVSANASWIAELKPASGQGNGRIEVVVSPNPTATTRQGMLDINGSTVPIAQEGAACQFTVAPPSAGVGVGGGAVTFNVTTTSGCVWSAASSAGWLTVSPATGTGSGAVTVSAAANIGSARSESVTVAGQVVTVNQDAVTTCAFAVAPPSFTEGAAAVTLTVDITTTSACSWTATSPVPWITVSPPAGAGSGPMRLLVTSNTGAARTATVIVAGAPVIVNQAVAPVPCGFSLSGTSQTLPAAGGAGVPVAVTTTSSCAWTASTSDAWITITSGSSTTGNGSVSFSVAANPGSQRVGTIAIAGQNYTVTQSAAVVCSYSINPTIQAMGSGGGAGVAIAVTTTSGCAWTAASNQSWLTITSAPSATGSGTVAFTGAANVGPARSGTLTIAGQTFTVNQASGCTYSINPTSRSFSVLGGTGTTTVTTTAGCTWTAVSNNAFITITGGASGSGPGTVSYAVAPNTTGQNRSGTITAASRTFTVDQSRN